jgi:hypothetical protein
MMASGGASEGSIEDSCTSNAPFTAPFCLVASTVRNPETFEHFLAAVESSELEINDVTEWALAVAGPQVFEYENRSAIKILHLNLKA